jgi:cell division transport system permease protein
MIPKVTDLPLARDTSSRFLPWLIAFMVYLAGLSLAAAMVLTAASSEWRQGLAGTLTVQVMPLSGENQADGLDDRLATAARLLRDTPGVASVRALPRDELWALLEPWLGSGGIAGEFPLPRLIDVRMAPGTAVDVEALEARLADRVPGVTIDDHGLWLDRLIALASAIEFIAFAIMGLICFAAVATVVFATRTGLAIHHDVIELLHLMGARDAYVAEQFQIHALGLGLKGGLLGLALTVATLLALGSLASPIEASLLPTLSLSALQWGSLVVLAALAALISMVTARFTVMRALARMP